MRCSPETGCERAGGAQSGLRIRFQSFAAPAVKANRHRITSLPPALPEQAPPGLPQRVLRGPQEQALRELRERVLRAPEPQELPEPRELPQRVLPGPQERAPRELRALHRLRAPVRQARPGLDRQEPQACRVRAPAGQGPREPWPRAARPSIEGLANESSFPAKPWPARPSGIRRPTPAPRRRQGILPAGECGCASRTPF
jgi:hypothetical protein